MSQSFRARFDAMVVELRANPRIQIYDMVVRPPASEAELRAAEEAIGRPLPADMRAFYAAHDGVFIEWGLRDREYGTLTDPFGFPDYGQAPGCINLLPVADAMSPSWEHDYHVNQIQPDHQALLFGAPLDPPPKVAAVCIDNFSKYNHGDLVLGPEPVMVVSTDHGADMDSSDYTSFSVYLDLTLAIYGTNRYAHGLGIGWTRKSQRVSAWTQRPSLEALLDEVVAECEPE
jgi:hypothetical protein